MVDINKLSLRQLGFFRYRKVGNLYLLTGESGSHLFLSERDFNNLLEGTFTGADLLYRTLNELEFIAPSLNSSESSLRYRNKYNYLTRGTSLHIVIPTLRCNHSCLYCHAKATPDRSGGFDMDKKTARKVVDTIFQSPSPFITVEFQGGEPLLNWEIVRYIIHLVHEKNKKEKRSLTLMLVSNLTLMDEAKLAYLKRNKVGVCTSLDGPKEIHDRHRPMLNGGSGYDLTTYWMKKIWYACGYINALATLTKFSLGYPREIIHEYMKWGMSSVPLRPVTVLGYAGERRNIFGISAEEFLVFYRRALDYLVEVSEVTKTPIHERMAYVSLQKIFNPVDPAYLDMRSPCGAGCGQLAYMYDGSVYTCDEARMLGNDAFKLGNVHDNTLSELMASQKMKAAVCASCLDGSYCEYCAYKPYCGTCPVVNWQEFGSIYPPVNRSFMCKFYKGMFDYLFEALQDRGRARILKSWIGL